MRILIDPGQYDLARPNLGCLAVLQGAVRRIQMVEPSAQVLILTETPDDLLRHLPGCRPVLVDLDWPWYSDRWLLGGLHRYLPRSTVGWSHRLRSALCDWSPELLGTLMTQRLRVARNNPSAFRHMLETIQSADIILVTGLGGLRNIETNVLQTLEIASALDKPTAMLGLGLDGQQSPWLWHRVQRVLPKIGLIALRENRTGPALLAKAGVSQQRVRITGDDAVELAFAESRSETGIEVGVNVRVMASAGVTEESVRSIAPVLHDFARQFGVRLLPLPSANHIRTGDSASIRLLLAGWDDRSDGGIHLETPLEVIRETSRCRLVVTGAYHVAVYALAQGIPAVCLHHSDYFENKMRGLSEMFPGGAQLVSLHEDNLLSRLQGALHWAWHFQGRDRLLRSAESQVQAGRAACREALSQARKKLAA